jgi:UDP-N-acetyl-D-glucosamine dehydrogenase
VLGVTYKPDVNDVRESPALEIIRMLLERGADVRYGDPFVPQLALESLKLTATAITQETLSTSDCVLIVTNHRAFDYGAIARHSPLVVDVRNALRGLVERRENIVTL